MTTENLTRGYGPPIIFVVYVIPSYQHCALKRRARKQSFAAAVCINRRFRRYRYLRVTADRTGGRANIGSERQDRKSTRLNSSHR